MDQDYMPDSGTTSPSGVDVQKIIGMGLVGILLIVGLMLPPVSLGQRVFGFGYKSVSADAPTELEDGLAVGLVSAEDRLRVKSQFISRDVFLNGNAGNRWREPLAMLPGNLELVSPLYPLDGRGQPAAGVRLDVLVPGSGLRYETLDLYAWDGQQGKWVFVPNTEDPTSGQLRGQLGFLPDAVALFSLKSTAPLLVAVQDPGQTFGPALSAAINVLLPAGLQPTANGSLSGNIAAGAVGDFAVMPLVRNYATPATIDQATLNTILSDTAIQEAHITALVNLAVAGGNDGVALDYRGLAAAQQESYSTFARVLANRLHEQDKQLAIVLPPPVATANPAVWNTAGYDWRALGDAADMLVVWPSAHPGEYTSNGPGGKAMAWATGEVSRNKLYMAASTMSLEVTNGTAVPVPYQEALERLDVTVNPSPGADGYEPSPTLTFNLGGEGISNVGLDTASGMYRYDYNGGTVWIMTAEKVRQQLGLAASYRLAGIAMYDLFRDDNAPEVRDAVISFKVAAPAQMTDGLEVSWVMNTNGIGVVRAETVPFGSSLVWEANVQGQTSAKASAGTGLDDKFRDLGNLNFLIGEASTPTPEPTDTPKPAAVVAAPAAAVPSTVGGGFELGGQTHSLSNPDLMHHAGMTWVKFQEKWEPGYSGYDLAGDIELAHSNGFKVLYSIPGPLEPSSIDFGAYIQFVKEVADAGADGIEIWNEMNLSREWPANDISGTSYVNNMLAPSYNAIKSVNPSTLVISGALAPTGAFGGGCGDLGFVSGCDDYVYVQQMAAAGAASYMDCVGVHFNAGATSPNAQSGHPAGDAPGWYFWGTVSTYTPLGKPICFTELGFLSDDGYATVAGTNFGWGQYTTVQQQSQWLAEAVQLGKSSARLLIVWNVDIFTYDPSDPQGGYAIIRPDGSCPACDTLAGVMN